MNNHDIRWIQRLDSFNKALAQLSNAVEIAEDRELSDLEKQGLIQAFEFTHELAWKTIKDFFASQGNNEIFGSKDAVREAFSNGIIIDGETWMSMIKSRNEGSHTYNEKTAESIIKAVKTAYFKEFNTFSEKMKKLAQRESNNK